MAVVVEASRGNKVFLVLQAAADKATNKSAATTK
jgi:hypothetical protein